VTFPQTTGHARPTSRETHLVELVDPAGTPLGVATVADAHRAPGILHRAFSVLLVDGEGRLLLQRRAAYKTRFPLRWANTCCGHPEPGQDVREAAAKRLAAEMGLAIDELREVGQFVYQAADPATGRAEHEYDHVLVGQVAPNVRPVPDPYEVADWRWAHPADLAADTDDYAPWLDPVVRLGTQ
jgi:isopentenyl-diphosphate delta-isomerase